MPSRALFRLLGAHLAALALLARTPSVRAQGDAEAQLLVLGGLEIDATWEEDELGRRVRGKVTDELGAAVPGAIVHFAMAMRSCDDRRELPAVGELTTGELGEFCIVPDARPGANFQVQVRAPSHETYNGLLTPEDAATRPPRIVSAPLAIDLESRAKVVIEIWSSSIDRGDLTLSLRTQAGPTVELWRSATASDGLTRLELSAAQFGMPGRAELDATRHEGSRSFRSQPVRLDVRGAVALAVTSFSRDDERLRLSVRVTSHGSKVPSGLIEVRKRASGEFLGNANVTEGTATIDWSSSDVDGLVSVSYTPANTYFLSDGALDLPLPARALLPWTRLLEAALLVVLLTWLLRHWLVRRARSSQIPDVVQGTAEVVPRHGPISGKVSDAHLSEGLAGANVELLAPSATSQLTLARTTTAADGSFHFDVQFPSERPLRLRVSRSTHMTLEVAVQSAEPRLRLLERRRAGLEALLQWVRQRGSPWFGLRPPTPGEARTLWDQRGDRERAAWAQRVERIAYAAEPPSEAEVRALQPESRASTDIDAKGPHFL